jgi:hypothetical protein
MATSYLGNATHAIAIALATNARISDGFLYIANPDDLTGIARVCVPTKSEARQLEQSWKAYQRAVNATRLPQMSGTGKTLLTFPTDQPVDAASWIRADQAGRLKTASGEWVKAAVFETWVTIEPHLQDFCRAFLREHRPDDASLTRRLEQRLGLPPASGDDYFVRIRLDHPGPDVIFRPCVDPAVDHAACSVGPPAQAPAAYQEWFYRQYYASYGQSVFGEFPWTALGYTFDWAPGPASSFQRAGESEFVIPKDAPIQILEVVTTAQYCAVR